jgi:hypothetical protein
MPRSPSLRPAALTRTLAFAGLIAAATLGASTANAADCLNGYRTLPNEVIVLCDDAGPSSATAFYADSAAEAPAAPATAVPGRRMVVDSIADCEPGAYWMLEKADNETVLACR